jgi:hypothetical protein
MQISLGALYGEASGAGQEALAGALRTAVRRYDIPDQALLLELGEVSGQVDTALALKSQTNMTALLRLLPGLLTRATTYAHAAPSRQAWALLADVYSVVYWLAARYRWMDLVEIAPVRQAWAASQQRDPLVGAIAARDRAGTFLNCGDFDGGLAVVDRAIVTADSALSGPEKAFALGILHLRGMTLAGRRGDRAEAQRQAFMLEQAQIEPGMRVLKIGFGGYNAALIAALVGKSGEVTTIDIDPDVIDRARSCLEKAGYARVNVVLADGHGGEPEHGPYDRIVVTVEAADLATAWVEQLAAGGSGCRCGCAG